MPTSIVLWKICGTAAVLTVVFSVVALLTAGATWPLAGLCLLGGGISGAAALIAAIWEQ